MYRLALRAAPPSCRPHTERFYFESVAPRSNVRWRDLREICHASNARNPTDWGNRLRFYLAIHTGKWLPLVWPPRHGIVLGGPEYFRNSVGIRGYRRFSCAARAGRLALLGSICQRQDQGCVSAGLEIVVSERGAVFVYASSEDRMYAVADRFEEFVAEGIRSVYSLYERDFDDPAELQSWYPMRPLFTDSLERARDPHDATAFRSAVTELAGAQITLGGLMRCVLTVETADLAERRDALPIAALHGTREAGLEVFGHVSMFDRFVVSDPQGCVYALLPRGRMVKLANSVRGFLRYGATWFRRLRRICYPPIGISEVTIGTQRRWTDVEIDYALPGDEAYLEAERSWGLPFVEGVPDKTGSLSAPPGANLVAVVAAAVEAETEILARVPVPNNVIHSEGTVDGQN